MNSLAELALNSLTTYGPLILVLGVYFLMQRRKPKFNQGWMRMSLRLPGK